MNALQSCADAAEQAVRYAPSVLNTQPWHWRVHPERLELFADRRRQLTVTDPDGQRGNNITAFVVERSDPGFTFGEKERKLGIKGSPTRELIRKSGPGRRPPCATARSSGIPSRGAP